MFQFGLFRIEHVFWLEVLLLSVSLCDLEMLIGICCSFFGTLAD